MHFTPQSIHKLGEMDALNCSLPPTAQKIQGTPKASASLPGSFPNSPHVLFRINSTARQDATFGGRAAALQQKWQFYCNIKLGGLRFEKCKQKLPS